MNVTVNVSHIGLGQVRATSLIGLSEAAEERARFVLGPTADEYDIAVEQVSYTPGGEITVDGVVPARFEGTAHVSLYQ